MFSLSSGRVGFIFLSNVQCMTSVFTCKAATTCMHCMDSFFSGRQVELERGVMTNDSQALFFMHAMRALGEIILVSF